MYRWSVQAMRNTLNYLRNLFSVPFCPLPQTTRLIDKVLYLVIYKQLSGMIVAVHDMFNCIDFNRNWRHCFVEFAWTISNQGIRNTTYMSLRNPLTLRVSSQHSLPSSLSTLLLLALPFLPPFLLILSLRVSSLSSLPSPLSISLPSHKQTLSLRLHYTALYLHYHYSQVT